MSVEKDLLAMQDTAYRSFQCKLMPTVDPNTVIGVRVPRLRAYAKAMKSDDAAAFCSALPHQYYEENNLHGFLINELRDFETCMAELERFLPHVDNWATCDGLRPKCVKKHKAEFLPYIRRWLMSDHTYTVRFAMEMLMVWYLEEDFIPTYADWVISVYSEEYYVNMMIAWYFATALAKQYDSVIGYLEEEKLPRWVHNKTIQKAIESYRLTQEQKTHLKTLKR